MPQTFSGQNLNGHPKGLYLLFAVEAWERFSYYGMRALLVLYMVKALEFSTEKAGTIYGSYTSLVYLTPLIGGYLADRYIGQRRSIIIGGLLMALGHFAMAFPPLPFFFSALALIAVGNGFFKPNISTIVGQLYSPEDPRRDGAFTIFYMGINLGAFFSPLICGTLGQAVGWHYGFAAAGVGMLAGLGLYVALGRKYLGEIGLKPVPRPAKGESAIPLSSKERKQVLAIFVFTFFSVFFWAAFEQAGSSLTLFADRETDLTLPLLGWAFPSSWFQSVNPLLIFLMAPLFSRLWVDLAKSGREPGSPYKFVAGLGLLAIGFVVMAAGAYVYQISGPVSVFWLIGAYTLHTLGELCLSPVGLSLVTKLAPLKFVSVLMGIWLASSSLANYLGGTFAGNYDAIDHPLFFAIPAAMAGLAGLVLLIFSKPLKRLMGDVH